MRRLDLDYLREPRPARWPGWLLLAAGALSVGYVNREAAQSEQRIEESQARLSRERRAGPYTKPVASASASTFAAEVRVAHATLQRLSTPWSSLFDALESAQMPGVRLSAIEPDAGARTAILSGEARDYLAILNYVNALESKGGLTQAHLTRHELRAREARYPMAFGVQVAWGKDDVPAARPKPVSQRPRS